MDTFDGMLLLLISLPIFLIVLIASGYLLYEDVEYEGYIVDITFSGGGFASPDMTNIYFEDGRVIQSMNNYNIELRTNCSVIVTIRESFSLEDTLIDIDYKPEVKDDKKN